MPKKTKDYNNIIFTPEVIISAVEALIKHLPDKKKTLSYQTLEISLTSGESWEHDSEDEFFADYRKGFESAQFRKWNSDADLIIHVFSNRPEAYTRVSVRMESRGYVENVFNVFEANVDKCRIPKEPKNKSKKTETNWVNEIINKMNTHCPSVVHRLKLALIDTESEDKEKWQNATMQIRDAWIELSQWLCKVHNIDTSDIPPDSVIERLKKLELDKTDERIFNLARASFNLSMKHHKRDIDLYTAVTCVISTIVSMKIVIQEVFSAHSQNGHHRWHRPL